MTFLVCGNLTVDDVVTSDGSLGAGQCGGTAIYAALGMWLWEASVTVLAGAGTDYPQRWLDQLTEAGMDLTATWPVAEPHALRSRVFYRADGSRTDRAGEFAAAAEYGNQLDLTHDYAAFGSDLHTEIWPRYSSDAGRLPAHRQFEAAHVAPGPTAAVESLVQAITSGGVAPIVTLDWPWWSADGGLLAGTLTKISALLAGAEELRTFGPSDQTGLVNELSSLCRVLVIKRGSAGCSIHSDGLVIRMGTVPVQVDDPTGAGDAFCGGYCVGMARTGDPVLAAAYGTVSASFVVETRGALAVLESDRSQVALRLEKVLNSRMEVIGA